MRALRVTQSHVVEWTIWGKWGRRESKENLLPRVSNQQILLRCQWQRHDSSRKAEQDWGRGRDLHDWNEYPHCVSSAEGKRGGSNGSLKAHYFTSWLRIGSTAKALKCMVVLQLLFLDVVKSASNSWNAFHLSKPHGWNWTSYLQSPSSPLENETNWIVVLFQAEMPLQRWRNCQPLFSHQHHSQVCPCPSRRPAVW